jgi:hypothetical protein
MNMTIKKILGLLALLTIASVGASAGCASLDQSQGKLKPQAFFGSGVYSGSLLLASDREEHGNDGEDIVGFWRVTLISEGNSGNPAPFNPPDDVPIDHGFAQWHSDGTEIMNSNRVPATGSFCLGVWKKVGHSRYKLNHFALAFEDTVHLGYANIREDVTLSHDGDSFSGTFTNDLYDGAGNHLATLKGNIVGTRIKVHTTLQEIL